MSLFFFIIRVELNDKLSGFTANLKFEICLKPTS